MSPLPGAPSPCPASVPLTQRGSRDFPLLRALQGRQPWGLLFSMARPLPLLQHCPFPGTLCSERTEMSIWGEAGNRAGPGGQSQSLWSSRGLWERETALEAGKVADGASRVPTLQLPPADSPPPPSTGCFHSILLFPLLYSSPRLRGWRGHQEGVSGGWLSLITVQNPRLSLAHLSFSFATFSALGSGYISRKCSPWVGRSAHQVERHPSWRPPQPPFTLRCSHHHGFQLCRSCGN